VSRDLRLDRERAAVDGRGRRVALVCSRFNEVIVDGLERGARRALEAAGVEPGSITTHWVPGAMEIPRMARGLAAAGEVDAVVALGAVIRGDTYHFEVVCDATAAGLMQLSLATDVVITNGVLTVYDEDQARQRSGDDDRNKGAEAAAAALELLAALDRVAPSRTVT
jgi:6,7-dimethyl-8-ribityllumazine synthase